MLQKNWGTVLGTRPFVVVRRPDRNVIEEKI